MPRLGQLYSAMEPRISQLPVTRSLRPSDVMASQFVLFEQGPLSIYYAPMDWLRPTARIAIVGITPDRQTMLRAFQTVVDGLRAGEPSRRLLNHVKSQASFSGSRATLVGWLDELRIPENLGLESSADLWTPDGQALLHPTSAIRYPAFRNGANYSGTNPKLTRHPVLREYVTRTLAPELERIPDALVLPLGVRVQEALEVLIASGQLDSHRCLLGFPHPSGANGHKTDQWARNRLRLRRKVTSWFKEHPVRRERPSRPS